MPIKNVPIVHKFGIISHSQRLDLQERLARRVLEEGTSKNHISAERKEQYSINEEFVSEFNNAESESQEKFHCEERAEKIFLRAKRKAGLRDGGIGNHVDLQKAWKELSLLAMCESRKFQEGALNSLYESLCHAPISKSHVKCLLELAERSIRWLTGTAMEQPYLRTGELKLLKVSHLVFIRLYYHHLAADIMGLHAERTQLVDMLQGFQDQQDIYRPFPGSLLLVRVIIKIGMALRTGLENELKGLIEFNEKHKSKHTMLHKKTSLPSQKSHINQSSDQLSKQSSNNHLNEAEFPIKIPSRHEPQFIKDEKNESEDKQGVADNWEIASPTDSVFYDVDTDKDDIRFEILPENIHDTSPTLWYSFELWRIVSHSNESIEHAIDELMNCSLEIYNEPMLDSIFALQTLAEVSKINSTALKFLQFLASRDILNTTKNIIKATNQNTYPRPFTFQISGNSNTVHTTSYKNENTLNYVPSVLSGLREFLDPRPVAESFHEGANKREVETKVFDTDENNYEHVKESSVDEKKRRDSRLSSDNSDEANFGDGKDSPLATRKAQCVETSRPGSPEHRKSISEGSLADVSSLASDQSRNDLKTRSSKRRMRRRANMHDIEADSDDSEEDETENKSSVRKTMRMKKLITRESTMSIRLSAAQGRSSKSPCTITRPNTSIEAMTRWPWELVVTYVRCLGEICMNGCRSQIQRDALVGCKNEKAGLIQMLKYQLPCATEHCDWSWRVRHVAVQELIKLCHHHHNDNPNKEGLQNAAWGALISHHSVEQDRRVLEAFKITRTEVNFGAVIEDVKTGLKNSKNSLFSRICTNLSIIHLTPMEKNLSQMKTEKVSPRSHRMKKVQRSSNDQGSLEGLESPRDKASNKSRASLHGHKSLKDQWSHTAARSQLPPRGQGEQGGEQSIRGQRTLKGQLGSMNQSQPCEDPSNTKKKALGRVSIRDEILIANALYEKPESLVNRSWFDVQYVAEDQWRKELSEQHDVIEKKKQQKMDQGIELLRTSISKHL